MLSDVPSNVKNPDKIRERRSQLIEAAVKLFSDKGFHKTTTREIAKASGLSTGAVYEYVQSKEDILYLVCKRIHSSVEERLAQSQFTNLPGSVRLRFAIARFLKVMDMMKDDILLIYQESKSLPRAHLREVLKDEEAITNVFSHLIRAGMGDGSLQVEEEAVQLLAHDIVVSGQMWAFRRWALRNVSFRQFANLQLNMLMHACGDTSTDIAKWQTEIENIWEGV